LPAPKEKSKSSLRERSAKRGSEWSRRNEIACWLVRREKEEMRTERRRDVEKDGECARVRSGRN